jgi:hypothetical protein
MDKQEVIKGLKILGQHHWPNVIKAAISLLEQQPEVMGEKEIQDIIQSHIYVNYEEGSVVIAGFIEAAKALSGRIAKAAKCEYCPYLKVISFTPDSELAHTVIEEQHKEIERLKKELDVAESKYFRNCREREPPKVELPDVTKTQREFADTDEIWDYLERLDSYFRAKEVKEK